MKKRGRNLPWKSSKPNASLLVKALHSLANGELEEYPYLEKNVKHRWEDTNLWVTETTLRDLAELTERCGPRVDSEKIRDAIHCLKSLGVLEDKRRATNSTRITGSNKWCFVLKLPSFDKQENLDWLFGQGDQQGEWEGRRLKNDDQNSLKTYELRSNLNFSKGEETIAPATPERNSLHQLPYGNLPKQNNEFIGRQSDLKHLLKLISLSHRAPIITVDGIGGVGKTALVVEAAYQSWEAKHGRPTDAPIFDAIIFVSAKENYLLPNGIVPRLQRESTLRDIFRVIASTLDDKSITQSAPEEQLNRVYESLGRQKTLLIVDNLETITEKNEVLAFLSDLPPSAKAVITTREQVLMYAPIRLDCLPEADSLRLILQQATEKGVTLNDEQSRQLYERFGGVPIALIYAIGQLASGYSIETVLDKSSPLPEDVARFCFHNSVQPLRGQPAHKLLMSLAIFSEYPVWDALTEVAALKIDPINANKGLTLLQQLSIVRQKEGRYEMLSLTREYALAELAADSDFEQEARKRWVKWYLDFAERYGQEEWHEWHIHYDRLEAEGANLLAVVEWLAFQERYQDVKDLWKSLTNYSHIYGYWEDRLFWMQWLIEASERRGDWSNAVFAMSQKGWTLSLIGPLEMAEEILLRAWSLHEYATFDCQADLANHLAQIYLYQKEYEQAVHWLNVEENLLNNSPLEGRYYTRDRITNEYYKAKVEYEIGNYEMAKLAYKQILKKAEDINWQRAVYYIQGEVANIEIKEGNLNEAEKILKTGLIVVERNKDKREVAVYQGSFAELEKIRGNSLEARQWATKALEGFNRLGMRREAEQMNLLLNSLE